MIAVNRIKIVDVNDVVNTNLQTSPENQINALKVLEERTNEFLVELSKKYDRSSVLSYPDEGVVKCIECSFASYGHYPIMIITYKEFVKIEE